MEQVGRHANVLEALRAATAVEGVRGLFRGTAATLIREVPFYAFGMVGYQQLKKVFSGKNALPMSIAHARVNGPSGQMLV